MTGAETFVILLTCLFITLKLTHLIAWSWIWVLAPLWIPWVAVLAILAAFIIVSLIAVFFD